MKLLVTGGSGFIGRNLMEYLSKSHSIQAPSHAELELTDENAVCAYFSQHKFDIVIHSAVRPGHRNAKDTTNQLCINLHMFYNLLRNKDSFGKLIFLSSGAVYGITRPMQKIKESEFDRCIPFDDGGFSKYVIAKYIENLENVVELRIFGIFGKYEDYVIRFISNAICKALFDLPITLRQDRLFDYLYIDDLMPVIEHFIVSKTMNRSYNITPDNSISLSILAHKIKDISGKDIPVKVAQKGMGLEYSGSNLLLREEMKNIYFTPIDTAIQKLYDWYFCNLSSIDKSLLLSDK